MITRVQLPKALDADRDHTHRQSSATLRHGIVEVHLRTSKIFDDLEALPRFSISAVGFVL